MTNTAINEYTATFENGIERLIFAESIEEATEKATHIATKCHYGALVKLEEGFSND